MSEEHSMPDKDHPIGGPERSTTGPLLLAILIVAGIVALFVALTYFVSLP